MVDPNDEQAGYASGWSVDEDPEGGFRWTAFGPAGTRQGQAPTRAGAERAAMQAEQDLEEERGRAQLDRSAGDAPPDPGPPARRFSSGSPPAGPPPSGAGR